MWDLGALAFSLHVALFQTGLLVLDQRHRDDRRRVANCKARERLVIPTLAGFEIVAAAASTIRYVSKRDPGSFRIDAPLFAVIDFNH